MATEEVNKPLSLPLYPEMILEAIAALNENNGSNKTSISKYIESKYGDLPAGHSTLLSHHLNKMKDKGELVFWKNNYTKADSNAPPRRGRGRPPKPKDPLVLDTVLASSRPRGRPPKDPNAPPKPLKPKVATGSGKPRGRPRKMAKPSGGMGGTATTAVEMTTGTGRPRGRPPKVKPAVNEAKEIPQKVLQPSISRRVVTTVAMTSVLLAKEAIFSKKIANAYALDFRLVAPDQTCEEAESVIRNHAQDLLSIKDLLESESWEELQKTLRKSSSNLKQDIYTIIQAKPGSQRPQLRKLYYTLFDNVTKLDYAARDGDASVVRQCYGNIVETLGNILSRI